MPGKEPVRLSFRKELLVYEQSRSELAHSAQCSLQVSGYRQRLCAKPPRPKSLRRFISAASLSMFLARQQAVGLYRRIYMCFTSCQFAPGERKSKTLHYSVIAITISKSIRDIDATSILHEKMILPIQSLTDW